MKYDALFLDPWCEWPDGFPYDHLNSVGVGVQSPIADVRDAFFELMERGTVDDRTRAAYNQLAIVGRRLMLDALHYDAEAAAELLALLEEQPPDTAPEPPLSQQVPFSWDV